MGSDKSADTELTFIRSIKDPRKVFLRIPDVFVRKNMYPMPRHVTISTADMLLWRTIMFVKDGKSYFAKGWSTICKFYKIGSGDIAHFQYDGESNFVLTLYNSNGTIKRNWNTPNVPITLVCTTDKNNTITKFVEQDGADLRHDQKRDGVIAEVIEKNPYFPHFYFTLNKSNVSPQYDLAIPIEFALSQLCFGMNKRKLKLAGKGTWDIQCIVKSSKAYISKGWKEFATANKLEPNETCAIEQNSKYSAVWNVILFNRGHP